MPPPSPPFAPSIEASRIVTVRDAINAYFQNRYGGAKLLGFPEERSIFDLVHEGQSEQDFAWCVQSLAGLATALDTEILRSNVRVVSEDSGSLNLLQAFLAERFEPDRYQFPVEILRRLSRIRNMYPAHTDRAKGGIEALRAMGIGYPIKDFGQAWKLVRRVYLDALESLLVLVRELAEAR